MNLQDFIVSSVNQSVSQVFSTMMGTTIQAGEFSIETSTPEPNDGVVSLIGIAGSWVGTGSIRCSPAMACRICSQLLMTDSQAVDEEVLDAVAELTNMIVGNVKTDLESHLGPLGLSIPTVVFGRNFRTKNAGHAEWIVVRFTWDEEPLEIKLCLAPNERHADPKTHSSHAAPQSCSVEA